MILFSLPGFDGYLKAAKPRETKRGVFRISRYQNGEMYISLKTSVKSARCVILGTIAPPEDNLVKVSMLAHTLKKEGASEVVLALPYLAYSRQDKDIVSESLAAEWVGRTLKASGVDEIATIDLHSELDKKLFGVRVTSISPAEIFANRIKELQDKGITIVSPDIGGIKRAELLRRAAKVRRPITYLTKRRADSIEHLNVSGKLTDKAVIVDDIIDTGATMISACKALKKRGVKEITVVASHGVLSGVGWKRLWKLGVKRIYLLDTIPKVRMQRSARVIIIPSASLFGGAVNTDLHVPN